MRSVLPIKSYKIAIVGGGLVGHLTAYNLSQIQSDRVSFDIQLFERLADPAGVPVEANHNFASQYNARNLVLSSASAKHFQDIGLWDDLQEALAPIRKLEITRQGGLGRSEICAVHEKVPALGYVADMTELANKFSQAAKSCDNVCINYQSQLRQVTSYKCGYQLSWIDADGYENTDCYDLVIAADGASSWICGSLGIPAESRAYGQTALVCNVSLDRAVGTKAYERFLDGGAITLLPLNQGQFCNRAALVWIDTQPNMEALDALSEQGFLEKLSKSLPIDANFISKGASSLYPLVFQLRRERVRPHLVVLGNAAQSLHPIAAQGFNLAVRDIRDFCQVVLQNRNSSDSELFSGHRLVQFSEQRASDVDRVRGFIDVLTQLFFQPGQSKVLGMVQDAALLGFELFPGAKRTLARFAMGGQFNGSRRVSS